MPCYGDRAFPADAANNPPLGTPARPKVPPFLNVSVSFASSHEGLVSFGPRRPGERHRDGGNLSSTPLSVTSDISLLGSIVTATVVAIITETLISEKSPFHDSRSIRVSIGIYRLLPGFGIISAPSPVGITARKQGA